MTKPAREPPEQLTLGQWMKELRVRAGWTINDVIRATYTDLVESGILARSKPFSHNAVSNWEHGKHRPCSDVVRWYEKNDAFKVQPRPCGDVVGPDEAHDAFEVLPGYLLQLLRRANVAMWGPAAPNSRRDGIADHELVHFQDHGLESYRRELNASRASRGTITSLTDEELVERVRSASSATNRVASRRRRVLSVRCRARDVDDCLGLAIVQGPLVGRYDATHDTQQLIADLPHVLRAIDRAFKRGDERAVRAVIALAGCAFLQGVTLKRFEARAVECAGDSEQRADIYNAIGLSAVGAAASPSDLAYASECYQSARNLSAPGTKRQLIAMLGLAEVGLRRHDEDDRPVKTLRAFFVKADDPVYIAHCDLLLAQLELRRGDLDEARRRLLLAATGYGDRDRLGDVNCVKGLADIAARGEQQDVAREWFAVAGHGYEALGFVLGRAHCLRAIADLDLESGHDERARKGIEQADGLYWQIGNGLGKANCQRARGELELRQAKPHRARVRIRDAEWRYGTVQYARGGSLCASRLADLAGSVALGKDPRELALSDRWMPDDNG